MSADSSSSLQPGSDGSPPGGLPPAGIRPLPSDDGLLSRLRSLPVQAVSNDEQFIRRAFAEDPNKGIELLFREYYGPLCSHATRLVYARETARDIVSDIFCVFWQKELHKDITTSFRAYLYTAVRNRSLKYMEREFGRQITQSNLTDGQERAALTFTETLTPEDIMAYDELHTRVSTAISELPPQRQRVFLMNRFEGKTYQTIADELQISLKAVEAHVSKALVSLRKVLRGD